MKIYLNRYDQNIYQFNYYIQEFILTFCGVKSEMQNAEPIQIKQSHSDRKPFDLKPVR